MCAALLKASPEAAQGHDKAGEGAPELLQKHAGPGRLGAPGAGQVTATGGQVTGRELSSSLFRRARGLR